MKPLLVFSALALAACTDVAAPRVAAPSQPRAQLVFSDVANFESTLTSCGGEPVLFTGTYRTRFVASNNTFGNSLDYHGTGVGLESGKHYSVRYLASDRFNAVSDVYRVKFTITGGGEQPWEMNIYFHTVTAANGSNSVVVDHSDVGC